MMAAVRSATAPVADFRLAVEGDRIVGYAAPARGRLPCLLRLEADGEIIAIVRASGFSMEAAARGRRLGWCGAELAGLSLAAAIAPTFELRCAASGRLLLEGPCPPPVSIEPLPAPLTIFDLVAHARRGETCGDVAQILPFAAATYRTGGIAALLIATFRTILRHAVDEQAVVAWQASPPPDPVDAALAMVLTCDEYRDDPFRFIPGPFHPAFAFDLSPLDG